MNTPETSERNVLPIWLPMGKVGGAEASPAPRESKNYTYLPHMDDLRQRAKEEFDTFLRNKQIHNAVRAIESALLSGSSELDVFAMKTEIQRNLSDRSDISIVSTMPSSLGVTHDQAMVNDLSDLSVAGTKRSIASLRAKLRDHPNLPLSWCDLALAFCTIGQNAKADRCMTVALGLSPLNRAIVRAAVRLYAHLHEPDRAHWLVLNHPALKHDPWLLACEVATSQVAEKPSRSVDFAVRKLQSMQWSNEHSTELRSAIGTLNIKSGKDKVARKHIEASMVGGNANAFAQASWLTYHEKLVLGQPETLQSGARSAEGLMYASRSSGNYTDALKHCGEWMKVEPFSLRPYREATHMALVALGDGAAAEDLCRKGLELRPNDAMLKNNRAVAEIYCGKIGDAEKRLRDIVSLDRHECAVIEATKGMVAFRSNDVTEGNRRYQKAEQFFKENGLATELSTALAFHGQELYRVNDVELAERLFSAAIECSRGHSNKELELLIERARRPIK